MKRLAAVLGLVIALVLGSAFAASALSDGQAFYAQITQTGGSASSVKCRFEVVSEADATCMVAGEGTNAGARAVDLGTDGVLNIPATVSNGGVTYTVVAVGDYAFGGGASSKSCTKLQGVKLPSSVKTLGKYAFSHCESLQSFPVDAGVTSIGDHAFYYCSEAKGSLVIPKAVTSIDQYAFCRCTGIDTVEFLGDAPDVGEYAFTGGGMSIKNVIFRGKGLEALENRFNTTSSTGVNFFYQIEFYPSRTAMEMKRGSLGKALVSGSVTYAYVGADHPGRNYVFEGIVPEWPEGTNIWRYDVDSPRGANVAQSCGAYAEHSTYRDLTKGEFTLAGRSEETGEVSLGYTGMELGTNYSLIDKEGGHVAAEEIDVAYLRKGADGSYAPTTDLVSIGDLRIQISGAESSRYYGTVQADFNIAIKEKIEFLVQVPYVDEKGQETTTGCWFRATSQEKLEAHELNVSMGSSTYTHESSYMGMELPVRDYQKAVDEKLRGAVSIPEVVDVQGAKFVVEGIDNGAFGYSLSNMDMSSVACALSQVTIPRSVTAVGKEAFNMCANLRSVVFEGDATKITWGDSVFASCTRIENAVWMDKKADYPRLFSTLVTGAAAVPENYYTISYYASADDMEGDADPLGSITISENVRLAFMGNATSRESGLWAGSVPEFPKNLTDDGHWLAPQWMYPGANADNYAALDGCLSDSCKAYAAQANDAYTLEDAFFEGVEDGSEFNYSGKPVVDLDKVSVSDALGRLLARGVDYELNFMREDPLRPGEWTVSDDAAVGGRLRVVATGRGKYSDSSFVSINIKGDYLAVDTVFTATVALEDSEGNVSGIPCKFKVTSIPDAKLGITEASVEVYHDWDTGAAISPSAKGVLTIPSHINYGGYSYKVWRLGSMAFMRCGGLTSVKVPNTVTDVNSQAFFECASLEEIELPESVLTLGSYVFGKCTSLERAVVNGAGISALNLFNGCSNLERVEFGPGCAVIPESAFQGCSSLEEVVISEGVHTIQHHGFEGATALKSVSLPGTMESVNKQAFEGSGVDTISFNEGATLVHDSVCASVTGIKTIDLSGTVEHVGASAFIGTGATKLIIGENVSYIAPSAFMGCSSLNTVYVEGDGNRFVDCNAFKGLTWIKAVVFRGPASSNLKSVFPGSSTVLYGQVDFYAGRDSSERIGSAAIRFGSTYRDIQEGSLPSSYVYEGSIPDLPDGCDLWGFDEDVTPLTKVSGGARAWGRALDVTDLANAWVSMEDAFRYSGSDIDPVADGHVSVVDARGRALASDRDFTVSYQRFDEGAWKDTEDLASCGCVRLVMTAIPGGAYHGKKAVTFSIARLLVGDRYVVETSEGVPVTYVVTKVANDLQRGTVSVGGGVGQGDQAIDPKTEGSVTIPDSIVDEEELPYDVTAVADYALYRCMGVTKVRLPKGLTRIGSYGLGYVREKTDTKLSTLACVVFGCDMTKVEVADDAFAGCKALETVVFMGKSAGFNAFEKPEEIQRYYCASYYQSLSDQRAGNAQARVVAKEGSYLFSLSSTDYYEGSDEVPELAEEGYEWRYESGSMTVDGALTDSMDVVKRSTSKDVIEAPVEVVVDGEKRTVTCRFKKIFGEDGEPTGEVMVGTGRDGEPAIVGSLGGQVVIPSTIEDGEDSYRVASVGAYAFGCSDADQASDLTAAQVPSSVTAIQQGAFMNCTGLSQVDFTGESSLASVGSSAFQGCASLSGIVLPEGLTAVETAAFAGSGLVRVRIPQSVTTLGKRAFTGCIHLKEAVIGGCMSLSLPAPDGADETWTELAAQGDYEAAAKGTVLGNASGLAVLDDYVFGGCSALERLVLDADMSATTLSAQALEGCDSLAAVVYGDAGFEALFLLPSGCKAYHTINYYDDEAHRLAFKRAGFVVVQEGSPFLQWEEGQLYAGQVPEPAAGWRWDYGPATPNLVLGSMHVPAVRIEYPIQTDGVDAAFKLAFQADGKNVTSAWSGQEVTLSAEELALPKIAGLSVVDCATDAVLASLDGPGTTSFIMPANPVRVRVDAELALTVTVQPMGQQPQQAGAYSLGDMADLAGTPAEGIHYSCYNGFGEVWDIQTSRSVALSDLLEDCAIEFESGDALAFSAAGRQVGTITYDDLMGLDRSYYPDLAREDLSEAVSTQPVIAITSAWVAGDDAQEGTPSESMTRSYALLFGQTEVEALNKTATLERQLSGFDAITVLKGPEDISKGTVDGLESVYSYTGEPVEPKPLVRSADGTLLVEDVDYEVEYADNQQGGTATVTITGTGNYKGTVTRTFKILQARSCSGADAVEVSANAALDAFPQGSEGAVLVSSADAAAMMVATPLAGAMNFPVLVTDGQALSSSCSDALTVLSNGNGDFQVVAVSCGNALSTRVDQQVSQILGGSQNAVNRLQGNDAANTSWLVWLYGSQASSLGLWGDTAILAGTNPTNSEATIASYAAFAKAPVFLTGNALDGLVEDALSQGHFQRLLVASNASAVPDSIANVACSAMGEGIAFTRLAGTDACASSACQGTWASGQGLGFDGCFVACGSGSLAGLACAWAAGEAGSMVLVAQDGRFESLELLRGRGNEVNSLQFAGSRNVLPMSLRRSTLNMLGWSYDLLD